MATYTERLQKVRDAIDDLLITGQSISYEGRTFTMANLKDLRALEKEYERRAARESNPQAGRHRIVYVKPV